MVRGGMYYELKEDYPNALDCYIQGQEHAKVSELLIRNAETFPGMAHYREMEKYYRKLPQSDILASPALIQGMSMLCAMSGDYEGSERWYKTLERFAQNCGPQDAVLTQARSCLIWLDISLPQRGVETLAEAFPKISRMVRRKELVLRSFSATSGLPSIVNGGKDFSDWCTKDDQMFKTMSGPLPVGPGQIRRRAGGKRCCGEQVRKGRGYLRAFAGFGAAHGRNSEQRYAGDGVRDNCSAGQEPDDFRQGGGCQADPAGIAPAI